MVRSRFCTDLFVHVVLCELVDRCFDPEILTPNPLVTQKKDWILSEEAFERLLALLDEERDRAGQQYETLRRKLIEFFEARGSETPDVQTDETINRVARKIVEGEKIDNPVKYFYGVARLLWLESLRAREKTPIPLDLTPVPVAPNQEEKLHELQAREQRFECFETCLAKLPISNRTLIVEYYREEEGLKIEHRKRQAASLSMSLNALRLRASRIRTELAACIDSCLSRLSADTKPAIHH